MARCVCTNPCTCYFEYDGDRPNEDYTLPFQYGRYSTRKKGSGTTADPYIIEFLDSEEFLVEAGQAHVGPDILLTSSASGFAATGFNTIDYETPNEIFIAFQIHISNGFLYPSVHKFWFASASADFIHNGLDVGSRRISIQWRPPATTYGTFNDIFIAGNATRAVGEDATVSCSGLSPFAQFIERPFFFGPGGSFRVGLQQNSGATMTVRNVKFTLVAI